MITGQDGIPKPLAAPAPLATGQVVLQDSMFDNADWALGHLSQRIRGTKQEPPAYTDCVQFNQSVTLISNCV